MRRDDFARLERRWREQPMFLPRRRRLPRWPLVIALLALAAWLGSALLDRGPLEVLADRFNTAFDADANPGRPAANATAARNDPVPETAAER